VSAATGTRSAAEVVAALLERSGAYVPELKPAAEGPSRALAQVAGLYLESLGERIERMPAKHLAALLDMAGVSLLPAQPAMATVVFSALPGAPASRVAAGTRLGAQLPDRDDPLPFETVRSVAVTSAALAEVWTVLPGSDAAANHGPDLAAGRGCVLFEGAERVVRELYLGDPVRLALSGRAEIELDIRLRKPSAVELALAWSWWDGETWQPFAPFVEPGAAGDDDSWDGTAGLTRSGRVHLVTPCAAAKPLTIEGIESCWIRARTGVPIPPGPDVQLPEVAAVQLRTLLSRRQVRMVLEPGSNALDVSVFTPDGAPEAQGTDVTMRKLSGAGGDTTKQLDAAGKANFTPGSGATVQLAIGGTPVDEDFLSPVTLTQDLDVALARQRGLTPDKAIGDEKPLDLTRSFQPLGQAPARGAAFYMACDEVFSKPGARVTLSLVRPVTASEEADASGSVYQTSVQAAQQLVADFVSDIGGAANTLSGLASAAGALGQALPDIVNPGTSTAQWYGAAQAAVGAAITALKDAAGLQPGLWTSVTGAQNSLRAVAAGTSTPGAAVNNALGDLGNHHRDVAGIGADVADALAHLGSNPGGLQAAADGVRNALAGGNEAQIAAAQATLAGAFTTVVGGLTSFLAGARPSYLTMDPEAFRALAQGRLDSARTAVSAAATTLTNIRNELQSLDPQTLVTAASGALAPQLSAATIAWEYWDGRRWRELAVDGDAKVKSFGATGVIRFDVPRGWEPLPVVNDSRRWLRARLASGSYSYLRLVSWTDAKTGVVNFLPVVEPRPPVLDSVEVFFRYESPAAPPPQGLALNDFQWEDVGARLTGTGPGITPIRSMPEHAPTLYLGFDGPLPADRVGLYVELPDPDPDALPISLTWEGYDGVAWRTLAVEDGTRGLSAGGVVNLIWPGDAAPPGALLTGASGRDVALAERDAGARFAPGDRVLVRDARGGEPGVVVAAGGEALTLRDPVSRAYVGGEVLDAPPARFGTPLTWLRARFEATAEAPAVALSKLLPNATEVRQVETVSDEPVGSSDGSPEQVLYLRRPPVLEGETVEVRELEGPRAAVDLRILERELAAAGLGGTARAVRHPRTGQVDEVWVRWWARTSLGLSGPADRHYLVDRAGGRIIFGDGVNGRIPLAGADNVRASYRTGGGAAGNVGPGLVGAMISAVPASKVTNPLPAAGGADGEPLDGVLRRGPALFRHRRMGISGDDLADLARETCPAVVRSRVLGARDRFGRPAAGSVRATVVPDADEARPEPDPELRRQVRVALAARMPATAAGGLVVVGPDYVPVGVAVTVRPLAAAEPGGVREAVMAELERFLHPLRGGPAGTGFDFGRSVFLSDVARALEALPGVDAVTAVALTRDGTDQGERVDVEPDQLLCAGPLQVTLTGGES
jgi:hypothetical protein